MTRERLFLQNLAAIAPHVDALPESSRDWLFAILVDAMASNPTEVFNIVASYADDCRNMRGDAAPHPAATGDRKPSPCKSCGAPIYWIKTRNGKNIPVDESSYDGADVFDRQRHTTHFETCPNADAHRTRRGGPPSGNTPPPSEPTTATRRDEDLPF